MTKGASAMRKTPLFTVISVPLAVVFLNTLIVLFPRETLAAAQTGVKLWLNNVLPSLLPFAVGISVLSSFGFARVFGALAERVARKIFNISGAGTFALVMGLTGGYPLGAKTVAELREKGEIPADEAQRLFAFANNSGPLFILGAVGVTMLNSAAAGYFILGVHYASALIIGLLTRFLNKKPAFSEKARLRDVWADVRRSNINFGASLAQAVTNAAETLLRVGGYIILFAVVLKAIELTGVLSRFSPVVSAVLSGVVEMANGCYAASVLPMKTAVVCAAAIISFGGLSVHAQSLSFAAKTGIKAVPYIITKAAQSLIAAGLAAASYPLLGRVIENSAVPTFSTPAAATFSISLLTNFKLFILATAIVLLMALLGLIIKTKE